MRLIGIHGKARSGKDELCKILAKTFGFERKAFADKVRWFGITYFDLTPELVNETKTKESRKILQGIGNSVRNNITKLSQILLTTEPVEIGVSKYPVWVEQIAVEEFGVEVKDLKGRKKYKGIVLNGIFRMWSAHIKEFISVSRGVDEEIWVNYLLDELKEINQDTIYVITDVRYANEKTVIEKLGGKTVKILRMDKPDIEAGENHKSEIDLDDVTDWDFKVINEHKKDWKERLILASANLTRKFKTMGLFTSADIKKFKINLNEHE